MNFNNRITIMSSVMKITSNASRKRKRHWPQQRTKSNLDLRLLATSRPQQVRKRNPKQLAKRKK